MHPPHGQRENHVGHAKTTWATQNPRGSHETTRKTRKIPWPHKNMHATHKQPSAPPKNDAGRELDSSRSVIQNSKVHTLAAAPALGSWTANIPRGNPRGSVPSDIPQGSRACFEWYPTWRLPRGISQSSIPHRHHRGKITPNVTSHGGSIPIQTPRVMPASHVGSHVATSRTRGTHVRHFVVPPKLQTLEPCTLDTFLHTWHDNAALQGFRVYICCTRAGGYCRLLMTGLRNTAL